LGIERWRADTHFMGTAAESSNLYGVPWNADGLSNVPIGKREKRVGIRFRAERDGTLDRVKLFFVFATWRDMAAMGSRSCQAHHNDCYAAGNGGQVLVTVRVDDGSNRHFPSGQVLSSRLIRHPMNRNRKPPIYAEGRGFRGRATHNFRVLDMPDVPLQAGHIYHLVFSNPAADHRRNYVSLDHLYLAANTRGMQPAVRDVDLASEVLYFGSPGWQVRRWETPIYQVHYSDGFVQGQGYVGTSLPHSTPIYGRHRARERITVTGSDRMISGLFVRLKKQGNPGPLTVRLENGNSTLVEKWTVSASSVVRRHAWVPVAFRTPHALLAGRTYNVVLSAKGGAANHYRIFALVEGRVHGFRANNLFHAGYAQVDRGSGWLAHIPGAGAARAFDFQIYMVVN
jgi:hypothetical protein